MEVLFSEHVQAVSVEEGYSRCAELARTHYENFSVGSWLLPNDKRKHIYAVYAFAALWTTWVTSTRATG